MSFLTRTAVCTIQNNSDQLLTRKRGHLSHGEWLGGFPPDYIKPGSSGSWTSQTAGLFTGVEGVAQYSLPDGSVFEVRWDNPYVGANSFSQIRTPNGDQATAPVSDDDPHADDLKVTYVLGPLSVPAPAPISVPPPAPALPIPEVPEVHDVVADCKNATHVSKPSRYDRCAAVEYAKKYWDRTTSDGFVGVRGRIGYEKVDPGMPFDAQNYGLVLSPTTTITSAMLEDCTHYTSCCIGRPFDAAAIRPLLGPDNVWRGPGGSAGAPRAKAGGLDIRRGKDRQLGDPWMYGEISAPAMVQLLMSRGFARTVGKTLIPSSIGVLSSDPESPPPPQNPEIARTLALLEPGDVIVKYMDVETQPNHYITEAQHLMLYLGEGVYSAHTISRFGTVFPVAWGPGIYYSFLQIQD